MYIESQFSIFMVNKPGVLAQILSDFAHAKINIVAMTMVDSAEHGVMRVLFSSADKARKLLEQLNLSFNETDVLCINLSNKSGALADVVEKLAKSHINIAYAYCTAGARGGKTTGVLKVADVKKAIKVLDTNGKKVSKTRTAQRRSKPSTS